MHVCARISRWGCEDRCSARIPGTSSRCWIPRGVSAKRSELNFLSAIQRTKPRLLLCVLISVFLHSQRSAFIGSTRAARNAGMEHEMAATKARIVILSKIVEGCVGLP